MTIIPYLTPLMVSAIILLGIGFYALRFWEIPVARPFSVLMGLAAFWALNQAFEIYTESLPLKILMMQLRVAAVAFIAPTELVLVLEYTGRTKWLSRTWLVLLSIIPFITVFLSLSSNYHQFFRYDFRLDFSGALPILLKTNGVGYWIYFIYTMVVLAIALLLLISSLREQTLFFQNTLCLFLACFIPFLTSLFYNFGITPIHAYDLSPSTFVITGILYSWALLRFRWLKVTPVARNTVMENMNDMVIVLDPQYHIVDFNPAMQAACGLLPSRSIGTTPDTLPSAWAELFQRYRTITEQKEEVTIDSGSQLHIYDLTVSPILDDHKRILGRLFFFHDITERKQDEKKLQEYSERLEDLVYLRTKELQDTQERMIRQESLAVLGQLAGSVAHELRNPLGTISNAVYYLKETLPNAEQMTREYLDLLSNEAHDMEKIISDLLDFARIKPVVQEFVQLSDLVSIALAENLPPERIEVNIHISPDLPLVYVDSRQMKQVLNNLITNGYQSILDTGKVVIEANQTGRSIHLSVTDTGCGIPAELIGKIFEPLFTTKINGIGLGLAIVKNLIEFNGCSIEVKSEIDLGSTFTIIIPLKESIT